MKNYDELTFGQFIEKKRKECEGLSLRATANAIGVSPQFYSEVEKGRRSAFKTERLELLKKFLRLSEEEANIMYQKAAESRSKGDLPVPQDLPEYIVEHDYVMAALRVAKELNAGEEEWLRFVQQLQAQKG